jgi:hypothetical protein
MNKIKFQIALMIMLAACGQINAQRVHTSNFNSWWVYNGDHKISSKFGVHLEAQIRRSNFITSSQQLLLRTGLNYHFNANAFATVGYAFVETYPYGAFAVKTAFPEHRIWEQVQLKNIIGHAEITTRLRQEQRFNHNPVYDSATAAYVPGKAVYSNRTRIMNKVAIPLHGKAIVDKTFFVSIQDEVFINYGKKVAANLFDQNRFYVGLGYKVPKFGRVEFGYLEQTIVKSDNVRIEDNHTLQLSWNANMDFYKHQK